jgi:hypothetical protein
MREEPRQRHAEAGEERGHREETPESHIGGHPKTLP